MSSTGGGVLEPTMVDIPPLSLAAAATAAGNDNNAAALSNNLNANTNESCPANSEVNNSDVGGFGATDNTSSSSGGAWSLMGGIMSNSLLRGSSANANSSKSILLPISPSSGGLGGAGNSLIDSLSTHTSAAVSTFTKSITNTVTGRNTLPDKTTASQVLMFRQLLHTACRPGLRLSRGYEGTAAQKQVLHMPWWERGIEQSGKMIISYDNLITRLWISGAILPFDERDDGNREEEEGVEILDKEEYGYDDNYDDNNNNNNKKKKQRVNTLVNERGLPPIPHTWWIDRLGFQQDDPVTDFRSGGVLSLAMLVHIVESCPEVHARFVPKQVPLSSVSQMNESHSISNENKDLLTSLEEIIHDDASVLPFGITCINITDMLAKFLLFSKSIDKMDALLSAKPFWKMFLDPNAMLVLQEVSLDLLCDVCVELGRERRLRNLLEKNNDSSASHLVKDKMNKNAVGMHDRLGKVTVFDFTEIMERTEKRVGEEVLGAGPRNVDELRAVARKVKSKYLMRIQLKEKHLEKKNNNIHSSGSGSGNPMKMIGDVTNESMRSVVGGVGGFVNRFRSSNSNVGNASSSTASAAAEGSTKQIEASSNDDVAASLSTSMEEVNFDGNNEILTDPFGLSSSSACCLIDLPGVVDDGIKINDIAPAESRGTNPVDNTDAVIDLSGTLSEAFDLLCDGDFTSDDLDAMDVKIDPAAAFTIDDL